MISHTVLDDMMRCENGDLSRYPRVTDLESFWRRYPRAPGWYRCLDTHGFMDDAIQEV